MVNYRDSDMAIYYCDSSSATYSEVLMIGGLKYTDILFFRKINSTDLVLKVKYACTNQ